MSSISSVSNYNFGTSYSGSSGTQRQRPSADQMAANLFSKLDTSNKGYIEQNDLETALSGLTSSSSTTNTSSASASEVFSQLDSNGDGKVTQEELSTSLKTLANSLDDQFNQSRMHGGMPPPPPPPVDDAGFTKDELSSQLSEIGSTDSARSSLISKVVENFDAADTDGDGKISFQEAMAYDQSTTSSTGTSARSSSLSSSSSSNSSSSTSAESQSSTQTTDAQIFRQIMELMRAYGPTDSSSKLLSTLTSAISTTA